MSFSTHWLKTALSGGTTEYWILTFGSFSFNIIQLIHFPMNFYWLKVPYLFLGHSLCSECLTKVQTCPNCRCALGNTRNFTLEKLTTKVLYTCRNKEAGCAFVTTSENIREHESSCNLTTIPCLLKCGQDFRKAQLWPHVTAKHQESILNTGEIHKRDVHDKRESHFVFFTCGELFRFSIKGKYIIKNLYDFSEIFYEIIHGSIWFWWVLQNPP